MRSHLRRGTDCVAGIIKVHAMKTFIAVNNYIKLKNVFVRVKRILLDKRKTACRAVRVFYRKFLIKAQRILVYTLNIEDFVYRVVCVVSKQNTETAFFFCNVVSHLNEIAAVFMV